MGGGSWYPIAKIIKLHGYKGQVAVKPLVGNVFVYASRDVVFLETEADPVPFFVSYFSVSGRKAILSFEDITSAALALPLLGKTIFIPDAEVYHNKTAPIDYETLIGFHVNDFKLGNVGVVTDFVDNGTNELLIIQKNGKELFIPVRSNFIRSVSKELKNIEVDLPDGLVALYYS
jgi:16S rRNA processing protein RimM